MTTNIEWTDQTENIIRVKSLRSNSKFKIQNSKLKTISGSLNSPLIEDRQIIRAASRREDCGGGLYPQLINSKLFSFFILNFEFCILNSKKVKVCGWWCHKKSDGCANCFAEKLNKNSFFGGNKQPYSGQTPELVLDTEAIRKWGLLWKPKKHFVSSMTDVFGEWVPRFWQHEMLDGMFVAPNQIFQILTKRPEIMLSSMDEWLSCHGLDKLPLNIWSGTSIENRRTLEERSKFLAQIPALIRFWSVEP